MSEKSTTVLSGYLMLAVAIALSIVVSVMIFYESSNRNAWYEWMLVVLSIVDVFVYIGLFVVNPNDAKVMVLFGSYAGSMRKNGFFWANPFYVKKKISLRARNLSGQKLKVNDKIGNPIEIAAVIVWKVDDTFKATFDVDSYEQYVIIQSEAAVRHLAQSYP